MNLFITFICIALGTMSGLYFSKRSQAKVRYYAGMVGLCDALRRNLMFRRDKLPLFLAEHKPEEKLLEKHLQKFGLFVGGELLPPKIEGEKEKSYLERGYLKQNELEQVQKFLEGLGAGDSATEIEGIDSYRELFAELHAKYKASNDKMGTAYTKLGFLGGLAAGIVLL